MPTRITERSATLIDHIYYFPGTKNVNNVVTGGNFWCDITDHFPNFVLIEKTGKTVHKIDDIPLIRLYSPKNIERFVTGVSNIQWVELYQCKNPNEAYNIFSE